MTDHDDDNIEFDFFEERPPEPAPKRGLQRRPRRPDGPTRPPIHPAPGLTPLLRLTGLIAAAIAVVVLLVVGIKAIQEGSRADAYKDYMEQVASVGTQSQRMGTDLNAIVATPDLTERRLEELLGGLITQGAGVLGRAEEITPPAALRQQHSDMIEALEMRQNALTNLRLSFQKTAKQKNAAGIKNVLGAQRDRFFASDIIWRDLFQEAAAKTLARKHITDVAPPDSVFLTKPADLDATSLENLWKRVHGGAVANNLVHGTAIVGVRVLPQDSVLSTTELTVIKATTNLQFEVSVEDSGEAQETHVKVTLRVLQGTPVTLTGTIDLLNPGETKTVTLAYEGQPDFGEPLKIRVEVEPVPDEQRLANNTAEYPVEFQV